MTRGGLREVERLAKCRYCGESQLAWYKTKAGRWMLCEAYTADGGETIVAGIFRPHKCQEARR